MLSIGNLLQLPLLEGAVSGPIWDPGQSRPGWQPLAAHGVTGNLPETTNDWSRGSF